MAGHDELKALDQSSSSRLRPARRHLLHKAFNALQPLLRQIALQLADALRLRDESLAGLFGELGLHLEGRTERAHARELLKIDLRLFQRRPRVVAPGIGKRAITGR